MHHNAPGHSAAKTSAFKQVDVFTAQPYFGNALAVVMDGRGMSDTDMQRFARWTNLAETTFLLPPTPEAAALGADYRVRIFSPGYEMPFAGHPTLGSCHAWLEAGGTPQRAGFVVQECPVGLIKIRRTTTATQQRLAFAAPPLQRHAPAPEVLAQVLNALGLLPQHVLAAQHLCNGPHHFGLLVDSLNTVLELAPNLSALQSILPAIGVTGVGLAHVENAQAASNLIARSNREARAFGAVQQAAHSTSETEPTAEIRFFYLADASVREDTVTGSLNASMAQWLMAEGLAPLRYIAAQGTCLGCDGRVHLEQDQHGQVWVGGDAVTCVSGTVVLP
jgi:PhzF family phenazine biosynthesis protein